MLIYLTPFNFRAPLIFVHLRCAKIKGAIFAQDGKKNIPKTKSYITGVRGARNLEARKLKARKYDIYEQSEKETKAGSSLNTLDSLISKLSLILTHKNGISECVIVFLYILCSRFKYNPF